MLLLLVNFVVAVVVAVVIPDVVVLVDDDDDGKDVDRTDCCGCCFACGTGRILISSAFGINERICYNNSSEE